MSSIVSINLYCSKVVEMVLLLKAFAFENCRQRIKSTHQWTILKQGPIKNVEPLGGRNSMQGIDAREQAQSSQGLCVGNRKAVPAIVNTIVVRVLARAVGIASDSILSPLNSPHPYQ
jgi:hypothetical protein